MILERLQFPWCFSQTKEKNNRIEKVRNQHLSTKEEIVCFSKVCLTPLCIYERPRLLPTHKLKEIQRSFLLSQKKMQKAKITFIVCSAGASGEASSTLNSERGTAQLPPQKRHWASQHQATIALNCVCEPLCLISIYLVHLLARCVLR